MFQTNKKLIIGLIVCFFVISLFNNRDNNEINNLHNIITEQAKAATSWVVGSDGDSWIDNTIFDSTTVKYDNAELLNGYNPAQFIWVTSGGSAGILNTEDKKLCQRFTAPLNKTVTHIGLFSMADEPWTPTPYYKVGLQKDNGSGLPDGNWVGGNGYGILNIEEDIYHVTKKAWSFIPLNAPTNIIKGGVYHIVMEWDSGQIDSTHWFAPYGITAKLSTPLTKHVIPLNVIGPDKNINIIDPNLSLLAYTDAGGWEIRDRGSMTFLLDFDDDTYFGQPWTHGYATIGPKSGEYFRETIKISLQDKTIKTIGTVVGSYGVPSGTGACYEINEVGGPVLREGIIATQEEISDHYYNPGPEDDQAKGFFWYEKDLSSPLALEKDKTYRVTFFSNGGYYLTDCPIVRAYLNPDYPYDGPEPYAMMTWGGAESYHEYWKSSNGVWKGWKKRDAPLKFKLVDVYEGSLTSITKDAESIGSAGDVWKQIKFEGSVPSGTSVDIAANSSSCGGFVTVQDNAVSGTTYDLPSCAQERYASWKLILHTDDPSITPEIQNVSFISDIGSGASAVSTPIFSPSSGTYAAQQNVSISTGTSGATIRYTANGIDPTESSPIYTNPISISETATLKAKAWKTDYNPSSISTAEYVIAIPVLTTIDVLPSSASVVTGNTQIFTADPKDQFGNPITVSITWNSSNASVGTINSLGVFTALTAGNSVITASSGATSGTASATVTEQAQDLIAHWKFDETSGTNASDSSGNNNDGTLMNMDPATDWVDGKFGKALDFDGTDDYVALSSEITLDKNSATFCIWAKKDDLVNAGGLLSHSALSSYRYFKINGDYASGETNTNGDYFGFTDPTISDTNWHYYCVTFDNGDHSCYLDGSLNNSGTISDGLTFNRIGIRRTVDHFNGQIDDLRIYSRALTPSEILAHYNEGQDTIPPIRSNGSPSGILSSGTTSTNISLTTDENSTCKYSTASGVSYASMPNTFSSTNSTSHSQTISGLVDGQLYNYYIRCIDTSNNSNQDDYLISFSISNPEPNHIPIGNLDTATESSITGWAYDLNAGENPIDVHIYIDGNHIGSSTANLNRPDIIGAGSGQVQDPNHGFSYTPIGLSVGEHTVNVYAINQPEGTNPELGGSPKTFTVSSSDQTPPTGSIQINSGDSQTNSQTANLTISANDSSGLSEMKISETNNFSSATAETYSTIKSFVLSIGDGIKTIYIWFKDTIGNWNIQPYSDSIELDSTGPIISNIQETNITTNSSTITFQTDENSTSQIEYGLTSSYGSQTTKDSNLTTSHSVNLTGLSSNTTYHYRIISEDGLGNSSNSIDQTFKTNQSSIPDTTPPQAITDLESDDITQTSADLSWTSPGDDGNSGTASNYDIRYSTSNITESNWNSAIQISGEPIPESAGTEQSIYIAVGLSPNTTYYFAIKTSDEVPNTSDISNILSFTTLSSGGGSPGGGGTISDTTPPSKPSNFKATGADKQITLSWNNPAEADFVRVLLIKKEDSFPLSKDDGIVLYEGTNEEYTDIELNNNTTYYYSIFAYDKKPNYSEALSISSKPIEGKTSIPIPNGKQTYPEGTLLKTSESFKIYVIINNKKKWIPTPEVFETLGYEWTSIVEINKTELSNIPDYEDNLIRAIQDYKVYLVVSGIKRHIPNPEIFLNYGFEWDDVKDVRQETINKYSQNLLIKESKQEKVYYLCPERKIRRWLRSPEVFNSYNNKWEDIQVISKYEMEHYPESNLIRQFNGNDVYLIEGNKKRLIQSAGEFNRLGLDWEMVMEVGEVEIRW